MNHHYTAKSTSKLSEKILKLHYCGNVTKINGKKIEIYQVSFILDGIYNCFTNKNLLYTFIIRNEDCESM